jgi:hypothetical protein
MNWSSGRRSLLTDRFWMPHRLDVMVTPVSNACGRAHEQLEEYMRVCDPQQANDLSTTSGRANVDGLPGTPKVRREARLLSGCVTMRRSWGLP